MLEARIDEKRLPSGEMLLRDVAISARPGETVVLLGPSGVGKTTLLRILLGLDRDFAGSVRRDAMRVGALFQEPRLLPWRTIGENIRLAIPPGQSTPDIEALLDEVGLAGSAGLHPRQVSLGMARRAALARALAIAPDLLVLDEPFASLDPGAAGLIAARIAARTLTGARRAALVMTVHDAPRATSLATRIIVLAGRPATIADDIALDPDADAAARGAVHAALVTRFPFLSDNAQPGRPIA